MAKPAFILACLNLFPEYDGLLWTDADSEFLGVPDFTYFQDCHISYLRFKRSKDHLEEYLTGTVFYSNTPTTKRFILDWIDETRKYGKHFTPEQDSLKITAARWKDKISWKELPPKYVYIKGDFNELYPGVRPVILHYQASRVKRK